MSDELMSLEPVRGEGATFTRGNPEVLFDARAYSIGLGGRNYDVASDDGRFLFLKRPVTDDAGTLPELIIVENWVEELTRLAPVN